MSYNPFSLNGKTILVTGASSGIGKATAIECSKLGAQLIITGRNEERLNETFELLQGRNHLMFSGDLCDENFLKRFADNLPTLDGIVLAAGMTNPTPFKFVTKEKMEEVFEINFNVPALLMQNIVKKKNIKKSGSVVFISSISGVLCSYHGNSLYSATKGAINGLAKGMALELATQNIRINTVIPAMIETNLLHEDMFSKEQITADIKHYPLKRYGKPEEVAYAAIYLLSDASQWVTGSNLLIDGGLTLR